MEVKDLVQKVNEDKLKIMRTMCQDNGRVIVILHPADLPEKGVTLIDCSDLPPPTQPSPTKEIKTSSDKRTTNNDSTNNEFVCPVCQKHIPSERGYKIHMTRMHNTKV